MQQVLVVSFQHQFGVQQPFRTEIVSLQVLKLKDCEASCIQALWVFTAGIQGQIMLEQPDCLSNKMTGYLNERRDMEVIYLDFGKVFDAVSHSALLLVVDEIWTALSGCYMGRKLSGMSCSKGSDRWLDAWRLVLGPLLSSGIICDLCSNTEQIPSKSLN